MADLNPPSRTVGGTELSWCRSVPGGTGITVVALLFSKPPNLSFLQTTLLKLQNSHPILRSKLAFSASTNPSYVISPTPFLQIQTVSTQIFQFDLILEAELNKNSWAEPLDGTQIDVFFATLYEQPDSKFVLALRFHTSACDRTAAVTFLKEFMDLVREGEGANRECGNDCVDEGSLGIEALIPKGKDSKPFWARGADLIGYSLNSFRLANLGFDDVNSPRSSKVARLQMSRDETDRVLAECKSRGIKLCGAISAAGLIAAHSSKQMGDNQYETYMVVTLVDCRKILEPPLTESHLGFYYSAILNSQTITAGADIWEVATRCYTAFSNSKNSNKHFTDMGDLNFLMCKAIENPGLTPFSSMRTSFMTVFEDPVIDGSQELDRNEIGIEDYVGCSSIHGVGPSIAVFDTIRDGRLDCACVYPSPLHSRERMEELVGEMKKILVGGSD